MAKLHKCPNCGRPATSVLVHFTDPADLWNTGCHPHRETDGYGYCFESHVEWGVTKEEAEAAWNKWCRNPDGFEEQDERWKKVVSRYFAKNKEEQV